MCYCIPPLLTNLHCLVSPRDAIVLRGAFMVHEEIYHVTTQEHYHIQKRSFDAVPFAFSPTSNNLMIYRNSDLYQRPSGLQRKRGLEDSSLSSCGADLLTPDSGAQTPLTHEYYHPPNLTTSIPVDDGFSMSSSWKNLLKSPPEKRRLQIRAVGPNPVPEGCPTNRLVNYMVNDAAC